jgi:hypothetical protein
MRRAALALGILALALIFRVPSHNWDQDQHLHPDERYVTRVAIDRVQIPPGVSLGALLDPARSPMNPRAGGLGYTYGALPLYLGKAAAVLAGAVTSDPYFTGYNGVQQTGRVLAGVFDAATALLTFLIGVRLLGLAGGALAGLLYAAAVLPIQISHFFISEPFMTAFMTATLLAVVVYHDTRQRWALVGAGLCAGLAIACKASAAPALALPLVAALWPPPADGAPATPPARALLGALVLAPAGLALLIGDPFAVLDPGAYLAQIGEQAAIQSGATDIAFTRQYVGTLPVLYPLGQLALLGAGPVAGVFGLAGVGLALRQARRDGRIVAPLAGAGLYFASIAFLDAKWLRYLLPLAPYLCVAAAGAALALRRAAPRTGWAPPALLGAGTLAAALAFTAIYGAPHTRVAASEWMADAIPAGARIGLELGDDPMPRRLPDQPAAGGAYPMVWLDLLADHPPDEESALLRDQLGGVDYVVVGSRRIVGAVTRAPWRYPVQIRYYDLLFHGKLGFREARTAASYPTLLGLRFPDDQPWIDSTFTEYDHPVVHIFKRERLPDAAAWNRLFAGALTAPWSPTRRAP